MKSQLSHGLYPPL